MRTPIIILKVSYCLINTPTCLSQCPGCINIKEGPTMAKSIVIIGLLERGGDIIIIIQEEIIKMTTQ
jgi:hypothetical protein